MGIYCEGAVIWVCYVRLVQGTNNSNNFDRSAYQRRLVMCFAVCLIADHLFMTKEVLSELHRAQNSGYNLRDESRSNHMQRAKICSKIIKYPNIENYAVC